MRGAVLLLCLVFSGGSALVYQLIWTRLLGLTFGTTTEAIGGVLAIFFGGMALGNLLAARLAHRVTRPLRAYAWLELAIGAFALVSLPALRELHRVYAWVGDDPGTGTLTALRLGVSAAVLLPPTIAMGATLPVVARGAVAEDGRLGRVSALLYAANTLGAVLGAYLCGFWLIPELGLTGSVTLAIASNLLAAGLVLSVAGGRRERPVASPVAAAPGGVPAPAPGPRGVFLLCFALSGFVAIGYEVVWSKVFGIVMEGTLYGFAAVLAAYLLGIALGSAAAAPFVDRIRDLPRAFALLHVAIAASVALGMAAVPYLPFVRHRFGEAFAGGDPVHLLFLVVTPIVLVPTALFGAAFPVLIRIVSRTAGDVHRGIGHAIAANTAGSIFASLGVGFVAIPRLGSDATLFGLLLLELLVALFVLALYQTAPPRRRAAATGGAALTFALVALSFGGVQLESAIAGQIRRTEDWSRWRRAVAALERQQVMRLEGRAAIVTLYETPGGVTLRTNGLPESGTTFAPPYTAVEMDLLAALPYVAAQDPERALVIGLGGGHTLAALLDTRVRHVDVVELEPSVVEAVEWLHRGRRDPLADPRVRLRINDGRNELLRRRYQHRERYDLIASQPSHPWRVGAANLFTREFFELVRDNLGPGGVAAIWLNGFRIDPESLLAVAASFERVFPGALLFAAGSWPGDPREALLLLGARGPVTLDAARLAGRLAEPALAARLALHGIDGPAALLARSEGPLAAFAGLAGDLANTDDNALLEVRIPRQPVWRQLDFAALEARLPGEAPLLPPGTGDAWAAQVARRLLGRAPDTVAWPSPHKLARLATAHAEALGAVQAAVLRAEARLQRGGDAAGAVRALRDLAAGHPARPEPWRALGYHRAGRERAFREAAEAFGEAWARSGDAQDAYDAGRALHHVDPEAAWHWFERIPPPQRARFGRLALYRAQRALARDDTAPAALDAAWRDLLAWRDTHAGRVHAEVDGVLSRLARRRGDASAALAFAEADRRAREHRAEPLLAQARSAASEGRLHDALAALDAAEALIPADPRVHAQRAEVALALGDTATTERALRALRRWAPDLTSAVGAENRFRVSHGLPLLPRSDAESLVGGAHTPGD